MKRLKNYRKIKFGVVISNKMNKTVIVLEDKHIKHYKYNKSIIKSNRYFVHDEYNSSKLGDVVKIMETKPISKNKCWVLIQKAKHKTKNVTTRI